ncbi:MAG: serine hydrolase [Pseudomonadota bacterium]
MLPVLGLVAAAAASASTDPGGFAWKTATPAETGLRAAPLEALAERIRSDPEINIHSVLVVRHGKLVFEEYFRGTDEAWGEDLGQIQFNRNTLHDLRSVTKSVTSAVVGIAIAEGRIPGVDTSAFELFPAYADHLAPNKARLTLHHILTMSAGLDWFEPPDYANPGNDEIRMISSPDPVAFTLGRSFRTPPGEAFEYNGGLPTLLGYLLEEAYGQRGDELFSQKLFLPLGISDYEFHANANGLLAYASGLRLTPRAMAKLGLLYLQKGIWMGRQLLPEAWVASSLTPHLPSSWTPGYGYQWWIMKFTGEVGDVWVPAAIGNGHQRIFILEPQGMVVVVTAGHYNEARIKFDGIDMLIEHVFPAAGLNDMRFVPRDRH